MTADVPESWHRRLLTTGREYLTHWVIAGAIITLTGFSPDHWIADLLGHLAIPENLRHGWLKAFDIRVGLVAVGVAIIAWDVLRRSKLQKRGALLDSRPDAREPAQTPDQSSGYQPQLQATAVATLALPDKPSIAVLPFQNMSGNPEEEYFSDGITEDLTTALSNTGWYQVTARHSAFSYKGKTIDVRQVGKELGVQYILEGSVRRMGDKLRVTAQLIETGSGKHIWGHHYDGTLADVFDFQDQITETIVGTVEGMFQRAEGERVRQKRPESMEAYDYLLRGLAHMNKLTPEDTRTALQYFYKAIERDAGYGRAYAYAFWCYRREVQSRGMILSNKEQAEAVRLMQAGLKADRDDPIVLWQAATLKAYFERDFEGALALLERSLSIDPNSPRAWNASATIHCFMGDSETARNHAEHAIRISPRNPTHWVAYTHIAEANLQDMRYQDAADAAKKALQLNSNMVPAQLILAASCAHLGRLDDARAAIKQSLQLNPKLTVARLPEFFPVTRYKNLDGYLDGLRKAGLPD